MKAFPFPIVSLLFLYVFLIKKAYAQEFPCDGAFYFVSTNTVIGSEFYKLLIDEATREFTYEQLPLDNPDGRHITCLAYNVGDKMIYGLDFNTYELLRIGSDGSLVSLGVPDNLDTSFEYYAGAMTADGKSLMMVARNKETGIDERVYLITMNRNPANYYAGYFSVVSDFPVAMNDVAVDPWLGGMYAFDEHNGQIVVTDITGQTSGGHQTFENVRQVFGALFFDRQGKLYGLGNSGGGGEQAILYEINKRNGKTTRLQSATGGRDTDGCACPYTLELYKTITPAKTAGCNEITIEYKAINKAGIAQVGARLFDNLPAAFNILNVDMENINIVNVNSGIGSNVLDVSSWNILLGENRVTVTAEIKNATPGIVESQATLGDFPPALGLSLKSDDPLTIDAEDDPTSLEILNAASFRLQDYMEFSCDLDTLFLRMPVEGDFLWSDGSTNAVLPVTQSGNYSVTVTTECFVLSDSLFAEMEGEPLFVDLGDDRQVDLGDIIRLDFASNADRISSISWSANRGEASFSCLDCPQPEWVAREDTKITLTLRDRRGCLVSDELEISVNDLKNVFVPNVFSPNADGINDTFYIQGKAGQIECFRIFDRWGNLVFEQKDAALNDLLNGWDGSASGRKVPEGVYLWSASIRFPDDQVKQYRGDVMVVF